MCDVDFHVGIKWFNQNHQNSDRFSLLLLAQIVFGPTTSVNQLLLDFVAGPAQWPPPCFTMSGWR